MAVKTETAVLIGVGSLTAIGVGLIYLIGKKPPVYSPGDTFVATFNALHKTNGGEFIFQVKLGHFDADTLDFLSTPGLKWSMTAEVGAHHDWGKIKPVVLECLLPGDVGPGVYDAEASINELDDTLITREIVERAITVRE